MKKKYVIIDIIIKNKFANKYEFISGEILFKSNNIEECKLFINQKKINDTSYQYYNGEINIPGQYNLRNLKIFINRFELKPSIFNKHYEYYNELLHYLRKKKFENIID
jgi:hypothetical protein